MKKNYRAFSIEQLEDRIYLVQFNSEELLVTDVVELITEFEVLGNGTKLGALVVSDSYHSVSDETLRYIGRLKEDVHKLVYATAIVVDSLPIRLLTMLFMNFYNTKQHRKVFGNKKVALAWLKDKRDNNQSNPNKSSLNSVMFP